MSDCISSFPFGKRQKEGGKEINHPPKLVNGCMFDGNFKIFVPIHFRRRGKNISSVQKKYYSEVKFISVLLSVTR